LSGRAVLVAKAGAAEKSVRAVKQRAMRLNMSESPGGTGPNFLSAPLHNVKLKGWETLHSARE
jgi:hypothetical protein